MFRLRRNRPALRGIAFLPVEISMFSPFFAGRGDPSSTRYGNSFRRKSRSFRRPQRGVREVTPYRFDFLSVEILKFSPTSLRRRKQDLISAQTACDLAKRWSRLAVARDAGGSIRGQRPLRTRFLCFVSLSRDKEMKDKPTKERTLCSHRQNSAYPVAIPREIVYNKRKYPFGPFFRRSRNAYDQKKKEKSNRIHRL